ncbi:methyltransferase [Arenibaculum pallidiluteum]|uniref:methyltransferase n=1 Tax=Arenibaculum pallidiluteum TaxID=2812559 RepID=UPI001A975C66|nr:methyltransferase [Arenibaculum pallidiluteum]
MTQQPASDAAILLDLIAGRWRSEIVHAAVEIGVFEQFPDDGPRRQDEIARSAGVDPDRLCRLLRALAALGLLIEHGGTTFAVSSAGRLLRRDERNSLRPVVLLEEGPVHRSVWSHLPDLVRTGAQDGFLRAFRTTASGYFRRDPSHARLFRQAMSALSASETDVVRALLRPFSFGYAPILCDIGGGSGHLLAGLLEDHPMAFGVVFDLPEIADDWANHQTGAVVRDGRCVHIGGDMFTSVPPADAYLMKHVLRSWSDDECRQVLGVMRRTATSGVGLYLCESVVPEDGKPHPAKILDIHMLCLGGGRQRTMAELEALLTSTGWKPSRVLVSQGAPLSVVVATPA